MNLMLVWFHLCFWADLDTGVVRFHLNDHVHEGKFPLIDGIGLRIRQNGALVLGQEQDLYLGGFSLGQSFEGSFANYKLFDRILMDNEIKDFLGCKDGENNGILNDPIVSFESLRSDWYFNGSTDIGSVFKHELTEVPSKVVTIFPEKRDFPTSLDLCDMLKGHVVVPMNEQENRDLIKMLVNNETLGIDLLETCKEAQGIFLWLGITAHRTSLGNWSLVVESTQKPITYSKFRPGYSLPHDDYRCVLMDSYDVGSWLMGQCHYRTCLACEFSSVIELRLRGLCKNSRIDNKYLLHGYENHKPKLEGIKFSKIIWKNYTWTITETPSRKNEEVTAYMEMTTRDQYPFGLNTWHIQGDECPEKNPQLLLTSCLPHQYTCNDGTCITKMQRCDLQQQCPDQSDERFCTTVVIPKFYIKEVPPARTGKDPATVSLFVVILTMHPVDTMTSMTGIEIQITLKWRDPRLYMESLNYAEKMNIVYEENRLWTPQYVIEDFYGSETRNSLHWQTFVAVMESGPLDDDITRTKEDEVYPGSSNSLKMVRSHSANFLCRMNLVAYPFDSQSCDVVIRLQEVTKDFVTLVKDGEGVKYTGPESLREYRILGAQMVTFDVGNYSGHKITVYLDNLSGFYVSSTYVPTFLMVIICYLTFFFHLEDFNDRIMVSLTALLVLATLFSQITQNTPTTAYLKLLDVWFVSCISIDFLIVVVLVVINFVRIQEEEEYEGQKKFTTVISFKKSFSNPPQQFGRSKRLNRKAQIAVPVLVMIFCTGYVTVALMFFFSRVVISPASLE